MRYTDVKYLELSMQECSEMVKNRKCNNYDMICYDNIWVHEDPIPLHPNKNLLEKAHDCGEIFICKKK